MNIYEIPDRYKEMISLTDDCDDESLAEAIENTIQGMKEELSVHAENLGKTLVNISAEMQSAKLEIERLSKISESRKRKYELIKNAIKRAMIEMDIQKMQTPLNTFSLRKGRESVEIVDEDSLPEDCSSVSVVVKPDKKMIKQKIDSGEIKEDVARLVRGETTLNIK